MKAPLTLALAYLLLLGAWSIGNPPGAAPDEFAHYLRALGAGRGELVLDDKPEPLTGPAAAETNLQWQRKQSRLVEVPDGLNPERFNCDRRGMVRAWQCPTVDTEAIDDAETTWVGTYPPYLYAPPGWAVNRFDAAVAALLAGRLVSMALTAGLIAGAIFMVDDRRRRWISHLGLIVAITPMVVFVGSSLTPNGPEIAAGLCFLAACLRLVREDAGRASTRWAWILAGTSALVLAAARDLGPVWVALAGLMVLGLAGFRRVLSAMRSGGVPAVVGASLGVVGLALALWWQLQHQVSPGLDIGRTLGYFGESLNTTKEVARQEIAVFGALAVVLPGWVYLIWGLLLAAVGVGALIAGTLRERLILGLGALGLVLVPAGVDMLQRINDFGVQGRHVMAYTVGVPLLAGEILRRHAGSLDWLKRLRPTLLLSVTVGLLLGFCWYRNMAFYMAGPGDPIPFWRAAAEQPPFGWPILGLAVALSMALFVTYGVLASRPTTDRQLKPSSDSNSSRSAVTAK